ncbi:MAG: hypothetical protein U0792_07550 [Gemmataceae bacterium]
MRLLQLKPGHGITRLALSPEGDRIAVGQLQHGVRVLDTISGGELSHLSPKQVNTARPPEFSPTARHFLTLKAGDLLYAETAAGCVWPGFQRGWQRHQSSNLPPEEPLSFPMENSWCALVGVRLGTGRGLFRGKWREFALRALSPDHGFAVGIVSPEGGPLALVNLLHEAIVAHFPLAPGMANSCRVSFEAGHVVLADPRVVSVLQLPPVSPEPADEAPPAPSSVPLAERGRIGRFVHALFHTGPSRRRPHRNAGDPVGAPPPTPRRKPRFKVPNPPPTLVPIATITATQPQPDASIPPFAMLPCGRRMLIRGEKSRVELRDVASGEIITVWKWGLPKLLSLAVSGNGYLAAAGGVKGQVMLWDLE